MLDPAHLPAKYLGNLGKNGLIELFLKVKDNFKNLLLEMFYETHTPANIYMFKVNYRNT